MNQKMLKISMLILITLGFLNQCNTPGNTDINETVVEEKDHTSVVVPAPEQVKRVILSGIKYPYLLIEGEKVYVFGYTFQEKEMFLIKIYDTDFNLLQEKTMPIGQGPADVGGRCPCLRQR